MLPVDQLMLWKDGERRFVQFCNLAGMLLYLSALAVALLAAAGCGNEPVAVPDAEVSLAEEWGHSAVHQPDPETALPNLEPALRKEEADTFAGLWINYRPGNGRIVVLFTRGGEETIRPYIKGEPGSQLVEVRNGASASMAELEATQAEAHRIVDALRVRADSDQRVREPRRAFRER